MIDKRLNFSNFFNKANILSLIAVIISITFIIFKGLNYGIDFKGGTLVEIRTSQNVEISSIRESLSDIVKGDLNVKEFGKKGDFLIKIEKTSDQDKNFIKTIKDKISLDLQQDVNFRRIENVGPKVSSELLQKGLIAILLSLAAMLFYIWIRFEWAV